MYELIDATKLGHPELERPLIITKYEQRLGRYRRVFDFRLCDRPQALEILENLNNPVVEDVAA